MLLPFLGLAEPAVTAAIVDNVHKRAAATASPQIGNHRRDRRREQTLARGPPYQTEPQTPPLSHVPTARGSGGAQGLGTGRVMQHAGNRG